MRRYGEFERYLDRHYRLAVSFGDDHMYLRNPEPAAP
jgi:hypothetical protein